MIRPLPLALALGLLAGAAQAHVVVLPATAEPGGEQVLRFVVVHGCQGQPTTALRVDLPPEIPAVKPQPKAGWSMTIEPSAGRAPRAVTWRGELLPHQPNEFEIQARLPARSGPLAFAAVQTCGAVSVRWDQPVVAGAAKPEHAAPTVMLATGAGAASPASPSDPLPDEVRLLNGGLADRVGRPLYTFDFDTMVGMSHCVEDCAAVWPPLRASAIARPFGDWGLVPREDGGGAQWTYRNKPLYTYSKDLPGGPATGGAVPNWRRAPSPTPISATAAAGHQP